MGKTRPMSPFVRTFRAMTAAKARQGRRGDFTSLYFAKDAKDGAPGLWGLGKEGGSLSRWPTLAAIGLRRRWGTPVVNAENVHGAGGHPVEEGWLVEEADAVDVRGHIVMALHHLAGDLDVD